MKDHRKVLLSTRALLKVFICAYSVSRCYAFTSRLQLTSLSRPYQMNYQVKLRMGLEYSPTREERLQGWLKLNVDRATELYISEAKTKPEVLRDMWEAFTIHSHVFESTREQFHQHSALYFPYYEIEEPIVIEDQANIASAIITERRSIQDILNDVKVQLNESQSLFTHPLKHNLRLLLPADPTLTTKPTSSKNHAIIIHFHSQRLKNASLIDFSDMNYADASLYGPALGVPQPTTDDTTSPLGDNILPTKGSITLTPDPEEEAFKQVFPFSSVYDFISEINRPPDPAVLSDLRYTFQIEDLKPAELENFKQQRRNPQEFVDEINIRLSRLEHWKERLQQLVYEQSTDSLTKILDRNAWSTSVVLKYKRMRYLAKMAPKAALRTQYDQPNTYITLIEQWQGRLKNKHLKKMYTPPTSLARFQEDKMRSRWRRDLSALVTLPEDMFYLNFRNKMTTTLSANSSQSSQPENENEDQLYEKEFQYTRPILSPFTIGQPDMISDYLTEPRRQYFAQSPICPYPVVLTDMTSWLRQVIAVQSYAGYNAQVPLDKIEQVTISNGFTIERIFKDAWDAVYHWDYEYHNLPRGHLLTTPVGEQQRQQQAKKINDHTDEFNTFLTKLNTFARQQSLQNASSVREMFRGLRLDSSHALHWWHDAITDLDAEEIFQDVYAPQLTRELVKEGMTTLPKQDKQIPSRSYTQAIDLLLDPSNTILTNLNSDPEAIKQRGQEYPQYREAIKKCEELDQMFPWRQPQSSSRNQQLESEIGLQLMEWLGEQYQMKKGGVNCVHIAADHSNYKEEDKQETQETQERVMIMVLPRQYRNINPTQELTQFLQTCKLLSHQLNSFQNKDKVMKKIKVIPMHPELVDQKGVADYARRSPYPAILCIRQQ